MRRDTGLDSWFGAYCASRRWAKYEKRKENFFKSQLHALLPMKRQMQIILIYPKLSSSTRLREDGCLLHLLYKDK